MAPAAWWLTLLSLALSATSCRSTPDASTKASRPEPPGAISQATSLAVWAPREGRELIGKPAPEWRGLEWLDGPALSLSELRGKVVLLRFWLTGCPYCRATAPALRELDERYRDRGLVVVGIHHPKSAATRDIEVVRAAAQELGFRFRVATDPEWTTLRAYGVGTTFQRYTSLSFLIDRAGKFRFIHDGGEFHRGGGPEHAECNAAYDELVRSIEQAL